MDNTTYAVFGLGRMGEAILYDLLRNDPTCKVIALEANQARLDEMREKYSENHGRVEFVEFDITSVETPPEFLKNVDVAFGAIDYRFNFKLTIFCIETHTHFLDLGGNPDVVEKQNSLHKLALSSGVTIIPDCGLAPGMANILAAMLIDEADEVDECHIRVGGLPENPKTILQYQQVFSIRGLTNEYLEDVIVIRDHEIVKVPSLTEVEEVDFKISNLGALEAFQTAGGTSSLPSLYRNKVKNLTYKTIRYKGHVQFFQFLKEFELLSSDPNPNFGGTNPREVIEYYLEKNLPQEGPDLVLVKIWVNGKNRGADFRKEVYLLDRRDSATGFSAMARTTAFPISILGQFIARSLITTRGVVPGEAVTPKIEFMSELEKRSIQLKIF